MDKILTQRQLDELLMEIVSGGVKQDVNGVSRSASITGKVLAEEYYLKVADLLQRISAIALGCIYGNQELNITTVHDASDLLRALEKTYEILKRIHAH